ncbi:hypothetical protein QLX08_007234 [Tetragonisca angustula]|uniref:Translation initiation factor eIF2B subunit beta n=1 Tax=Tetragonisca angustula TaxID=166442 RepID=A0AAW0ZQC8_9HYME
MVNTKDNDINQEVLDLINDIHYGGVKRTHNIVVATILVLKNIISNEKWTTAKNLINIIRTNGKYLVEAIPLEFCIGNMVRRILQIIREEYIELKNNTEETDTQESLHKILTAEENITQQASEHIHSNEIIMTIGKSTLVEEFFKKAAATRAFEVIVAEGGPSLTGHDMAVNLSKAKIKTTLISDVAIFAMMSRVNKVIIGTHSVMANGGLRAISGSHTVAQAAKHYSVPVMVLLPLYKLSPLYLYSHEQDGFNNHVSPLQGVIDGANVSLLERIHVYNPVFDYVPPELVTLFISNTGGNAPSYIYRLLSELYHPDDYEL